MTLVDDWKKLWKSWTIWAAGIGIVIPDLLQVLADNSDAIPWFDSGYKSGIRLACLVGVILLRPIKQKSVSGE